MDREQVDWHLRNWRRWMRRGGMRWAWVQAESLGAGYSARMDFEDMCMENDVRLARATDAVIRDLAEVLRDALFTEYLGRAWLHTRLLSPWVAEAQKAVGEGLEARGIV